MSSMFAEWNLLSTKSTSKSERYPKKIKRINHAVGFYFVNTPVGIPVHSQLYAFSGPQPCRASKRPGFGQVPERFGVTGCRNLFSAVIVCDDGDIATVLATS